jgi:hypothetical protein
LSLISIFSLGLFPLHFWNDFDFLQFWFIVRMNLLQFDDQFLLVLPISSWGWWCVQFSLSDLPSAALKSIRSWKLLSWTSVFNTVYNIVIFELAAQRLSTAFLLHSLFVILPGNSETVKLFRKSSLIISSIVIKFVFSLWSRIEAFVDLTLKICFEEAFLIWRHVLMGFNRRRSKYLLLDNSLAVDVLFWQETFYLVSSFLYTEWSLL